RLALLKEIAKSARPDELPAASLHLLGANLSSVRGDLQAGETVLREGQRRYPGDVWINLDLARCLERLGKRDEAIRYYIAARSLRPETAHELAHSLEEKGETDHAVAVFRDLVRLRPRDARHLNCLARALNDGGRTKDANLVLDAAIAASRETIRLHPQRWP